MTPSSRLRLHLLACLLAGVGAVSLPLVGAAQTAASAPTVTPFTVLKAVFDTRLGTIDKIGTGFLLETPEAGTVYVTALHVFGPPGGLDEWVSGGDLPQVVSSATLTDAFTEEAAGRVVGVVPTPQATLPTADGREQGRDFAVFRLADAGVGGLVAAPDPVGDDALWIVSPGLPGGSPFPVERVQGPSAVLTVAIPEDLQLPFGISGSPIVTQAGRVVGLVTMLGTGPGGGRVIHATPVETVLGALVG